MDLEQSLPHQLYDMLLGVMLASNVLLCNISHFRPKFLQQCISVPISNRKFIKERLLRKTHTCTAIKGKS